MSKVTSVNEEEWRPVVGFEGLYEVSSLGRIKSSRRNIILKAGDDGRGYLFVGLFRAGKKHNCRVHRLVAAAFLGPCQDGYEVNHKKGNKYDNRATELEYMTRAENNKHSRETGLNASYGEAMPRHKLKEFEVIKIRELSEQGMTRVALAKMFNVAGPAISKIVLRRTWTHV